MTCSRSHSKQIGEPNCKSTLLEAVCGLDRHAFQVKGFSCLPCPELSLSYSNTVAISGTQIGCLQAHQGTSWKRPNSVPWKGAPAGLGAPGPVRPRLASPHVGDDSEETPPGAAVAKPSISTGSSFTAYLCCPPTFWLSQNIWYFQKKPSCFSTPCLQIFCPSCLLVLKKTPAHPLRPSSRVTSAMKHSVIFSQADGTAPPLPPLSVL